MIDSEQIERANKIVAAALEVRAERPVALDVSELTSFADILVILSGRSDRQVRAIVDNPDALLVPGIFVRVRVPRRLPESVLVPESALQRDLTGYYVFTVDENREVSRADVVPGPLVKAYRSIQNGLTGDAEVIIKGLQRVRPGLVVDAETVTLPAIEQPGAASESVEPAGE